MKNNFTSTIFIFILISILISCTKSKNEFEPITDDEAVEILNNNFVFINEMTNIEGTRKCIGVAGCDYVYKIMFNLPDTLSSSDWLESLVLSISDKHDKLLFKKSTYQYIYDDPLNSWPDDDKLGYSQKTMKYVAETATGD